MHINGLRLHFEEGILPVVMVGEKVAQLRIRQVGRTPALHQDKWKSPMLV